MTKHNYLFEIGLEEVPAKYVDSARQQLAQLTADYLTEQRVSYDRIESFATPRRLAVYVVGLADRQTDLEEVAKGPARKVAQDEDGNWTKAAIGFSRGKGLSPDDIYFEEIKGVDYAHVRVHQPGQPVQEILGNLYTVIDKIYFPVTMHWANESFEFIRPIHWFVSLLDDQVVPFEFLGVKAGRTSRGHRFLGQNQVDIDQADNYLAILRDQYVIADPVERKQMIVDQIEGLAAANDFAILVDHDLLDEVINIVEYPTAFVGDFDEKYLELPRQVLITTMQDHQRYFPVENKQGKLINHFVAVRNGLADHIDMVRAGNEKVLVARLEDAVFFVNEDQSHTIDDFAQKARKMTFHAEIGTMGDKMDRVGRIATYLKEKWQKQADGAFSQVQKADLDRTSKIYKFDLTTGIVDEFSELQGTMGEIYANQAGESAQVAQAIREHYLPLAAGGDLPTSDLGILFAVADKLDTIISFFNIGRIPTGSNDPFALRRQMIGIISILSQYQLPFDWQVDLALLLKDIYQLDDQAVAERIDQVGHFVDDRLKQNYQQAGVRYDISEAVRASDQADVVAKHEAAQVLNQHSQDPDFKTNVEAWSRILNLGSKAQELGVLGQAVNSDLFETDSEAALYQASLNLANQAGAESRYQDLKSLVPLIEAFFAENMVFTDNEAVRDNRLAILAGPASQIRQLADTNKIVTK
ncbi:glycine--tRNA ligase subunit beta [Aerococcus urinaehominis]|uniref:Glycine--tRNA ligase beta subunit n=1 Tax=Aerococcus urinaehominis TaxID=128944 RepID=A0A109RGJ2_9LACT|nr:glycine--tRNA ligase subunit beta [Aerococcus urinaehominis]AMB98526.1 glycine--tRNA ligase subunit beta [Aerococcus urinaehominis]SDL79434.1 glycyl-tRNA synthetase beta chain [Aerococcus urinaehominis]